MYNLAAHTHQHILYRHGTARMLSTARTDRHSSPPYSVRATMHNRKNRASHLTPCACGKFAIHQTVCRHVAMYVGMYVPVCVCGTREVGAVVPITSSFTHSLRHACQAEKDVDLPALVPSAAATTPAREDNLLIFFFRPSSSQNAMILAGLSAGSRPDPHLQPRLHRCQSPCPLARRQTRSRAAARSVFTRPSVGDLHPVSR